MIVNDRPFGASSNAAIAAACFIIETIWWIGLAPWD
jgi:hypothetical protein